MSATDAFGNDVRNGCASFQSARADLLALSGTSTATDPGSDGQSSVAVPETFAGGEVSGKSPAPSAPLCGDPTCESRSCTQEAIDAWDQQLQANAAALFAGSLDLAWREPAGANTELPVEPDSADVPWIDQPWSPPVEFVDCERPVFTYICAMCHHSVTHEPGRIPKGWRRLYDEVLCGAECVESYRDRNRGWMPR